MPSSPCLLLDVGNTRIKWSHWDGRALGLVTAVPHRGAVPEGFWNTLPQVSVAALASVGPVTLTEVLTAGLQALGMTVRRAQSGRRACGVRSGYAQPEQLGVDRWLALIGACQQGRGAALVVSAGTALTVDLLDAQGQHCGGVIAPGLSLLRQCLSDAVATLPSPAARLGGRAELASATEPALANGALYGALGFIERVYADAHLRHAPLTLWLHGGDAELLRAELRLPCQVVPELVLRGLSYWVDEVGCAN